MIASNHYGKTKFENALHALLFIKTHSLQITFLLLANIPDQDGSQLKSLSCGIRY